MHYNKMEAIREKGIAEKMILSKDYVSARDKLLKAKKLFPRLDHIDPMVTVCDILSAASSSIPGYDIDYYWVLRLMPSSTTSDVRSRYQKLVSLLEPIRKNFPGTELAVKLVCDAFSVLSDRDKRFAFDLSRGNSWANYGSYDIEGSLLPSISGKESIITAQISSGCESVSSDQTLGGEIGEGLSVDMLSESTKILGSKEPANDLIDEQLSNLKEHPHWSSKDVAPKGLQDYHDFESERRADSFETGQIWAAHYRSAEFQTCRYAQINSKLDSEVHVIWLKPVPVTESERRWCDAGLPVACGPFDLDLELSEKLNQPVIFSHKCSWVPGITEERVEIYPKRGEVWALYEDWSLEEWTYNPENVKRCSFKLVEILSDFSKYLGAKAVWLVKVDGFRSIFQRQKMEEDQPMFHISPSNIYMLSHKVPAYQFTGGERDGVVSGMFELDQFALPDGVIPNTDCLMISRKGNPNGPIFDTPIKQLPSLKSHMKSKILGPNWSRNNFSTGQVWAIYCGKDLMPRQYVLINNVISETQVCATLLEPQPIFDYEIDWKKENLPIVCGIYRASDININLEISQFSHSVNCLKSTTKPIYKIYPTKGQVWAIYKNWNIKWKHSDYENYQCWTVEALSDFSGDGMTIARLEAVKGCLTFFNRQQHNGFDLTRAVSKTEMLSFSHQIPAYRVPGIGQHGIPERSWHLEPDALPPMDGNLI